MAVATMSAETPTQRWFRLLEEVLADEQAQRAFAEASRRLRDAHRAEFERLLAEVRGEVGS